MDKSLTREFMNKVYSLSPEERQSMAESGKFNGIELTDEQKATLLGYVAGKPAKSYGSAVEIWDEKRIKAEKPEDRAYADVQYAINNMYKNPDEARAIIDDNLRNANSGLNLDDPTMIHLNWAALEMNSNNPEELSKILNTPFMQKLNENSFASLDTISKDRLAGILELQAKERMREAVEMMSSPSAGKDPEKIKQDADKLLKESQEKLEIVAKARRTYHLEAGTDSSTYYLGLVHALRGSHEDALKAANRLSHDYAGGKKDIENFVKISRGESIQELNLWDCNFDKSLKHYAGPIQQLFDSNNRELTQSRTGSEFGDRRLEQLEKLTSPEEIKKIKGACEDLREDIIRYNETVKTSGKESEEATNLKEKISKSIKDIKEKISEIKASEDKLFNHYDEKKENTHGILDILKKIEGKLYDSKQILKYMEPPQDEGLKNQMRELRETYDIRVEGRAKVDKTALQSSKDIGLEGIDKSR